MSYYDDTGAAIETTGPDIFFDETPAEPERDAESMSALLSVVFELGTWAGGNEVKRYAARTVMRQTAQCVRLFAKEQKVSESLVFLRIREAKKLIGLSPTERP